MHRHRRRWLFLLVLVAGLVAFGGFWYETARQTAPVEPDFGGVYVEGVAGAPSRPNPLFAAESDVDEALVALVFAGLTRLDDQGRPFPDLAETWTLSADGRVYSFTLRRGLVWHNGAPLTTEDVVFTYSFVRSAGTRIDPGLVRALATATITKLDDRTINFELSEPFAALPAYLTLGILPSQLLATKTASALADDPFNQAPVGAGPFRLESVTQERAILVANPGHHLGQPFVQRLELRFFRDERMLFAALKAREVDAALLTSLSPSDLVQVEGRSGFRLTALTTTEITFVYLNNRLPMFQDRRVRQALLYALDRETMIRDVLDGTASPTDSPFSPSGWSASDSLRRYAFDPVVAGLLLDEAGWRLASAGTRIKDGRELSFRLSTNTDPVRVAVANELIRRWAEIGVRVTLDAIGATNLVRDVLEPRTYEAVLFALTSGPEPDPYAAWHSSQASGRGLNFALLRDNRFDRLAEESRVAPAPRRGDLLEAFQELFAQEVPSIPLYAGKAFYVQRDSLRGVRLGLLLGPGSRFWQVQEWHLRTR